MAAASLTRVLAVCWLVSVTCRCEDLAANEYEYSVKRQWLMEAEEEFEGINRNLNEDEQIVDSYLKYLKWREFLLTKGGDFPPFRPIEDVMDNITSSELYSHLKTLPKGGNMHSHENHQVSKRTLLEIVWESDDFEHLYMRPEGHPDEWMLDFFITPPDPQWLNVKNSNYTMEDILQRQTFLGLISERAKSRVTDSGLRWSELNVLWIRGSTQLIANLPIKIRYIEELLKSSLAEGVQYLETRKSLSLDERLYVLDPAVNGTGKRVLDEEDGEMDIKLTMEIVSNFTALHPEFIGLRRIVYTHRMGDDDTILEDAARAGKFHNKYPEHILGFDMVGEEDAGNSHLFYVGPLTSLVDPDTGTSAVPLYLHASETNWPADLISSINDEDPVATVENAYEAILLGAKRIGHGLGFIKHPYLLQLLKERQIPIEACIISNQMLGYTADLRSHPALHYYRNGIPVVLGSDDPGTFGADFFTLDWFQAFMGWGLDLADLRTLALNSLRYSSMTDDEKDEAENDKWKPQWNKYIQEKKDFICSQTFTSNSTYARIFPKEGALSGKTKVHLFGRHFEQAICKIIMCKFGEFEATRGHYVSQNHIVCEAPDPQTSEELSVDLVVSIDGGNSYTIVEKFVYKHEPYTTTIPPQSSTPISAAVSQVVAWPVLLAVYLICWAMRL